MTASGFTIYMAAFRDGLSEMSFTEGGNVRIESRWADGNYNRLPTLAAELVAQHVDMIVTAGGNPPAQAAKAATSTIPIVFISGGDPVLGGMVASFNRPGGNVTGVSWMARSLSPSGWICCCGLFPTRM
jgi:putative tryptophan/tyrosine transport system substrate-binding protein